MPALDDGPWVMLILPLLDACMPSPPYEAVIVCAPAALGVYATEHSEAFSVQVVPLNVPVLLLLKVTVPVGVVAPSPEVSLTDAVQVADIPCWSVLGAQLTLVEDERIVAVTIVAPPLAACALLPL
jgi:hypothetical protein